MRMTISMIGENHPAVLNVGKSPMDAVDAPMTVRVMMNAMRPPKRSPILPKNSEANDECQMNSLMMHRLENQYFRDLSTLGKEKGRSRRRSIWQQRLAGKLGSTRSNSAPVAYGMSIFTIWPAPAGAAPKFDT
jgi:hypothetical protein